MLGSATARAWRTSGCAGVCVCMCVCKVACSMCVRVCGCAGGWRGDGWGHKALQVATAVLLSPTQPPALPPTHAPLPATHARHAHSSNVACVSACEAWCVTGTHTRGSHTALHQYENGMHTHEHSHHMCRAYITTQQPPPPFTCCFWSARARCAAANSSAFTFTSDLLACTCASKSVIARR